MQINLLSFNQSELCVELRPRPSSDQSSNELEPLKLSVTWSHNDRFSLQVTTPDLIKLINRLSEQLIKKNKRVCVQVDEGTAGLVEDSVSGRRCELSAALLDVLQCYMGQFELLSEIQGLRSR